MNVDSEQSLQLNQHINQPLIQKLNTRFITTTKLISIIV